MTTNGSINPESLLGNLVPNIYIDCITLETTGAPMENRNPHIQHPQEEKQKLRTPEFLKVHLDLVIKERLGDSTISRWFDKIDFTKYLDIVAFQSSKLVDTEYVLQNNINFSRPSFLRDLRYRLKEKRISALHDKVLDSDRRQRNNTDTRTTSDDLPSKLNQHYSYIDQDGNKIHDITYRITFEHVNVNPKHLSYFVFCAIDLEKLSTNLNLNLADSSINNLTGRVASELVINDFRTLSQSQIFRDQNGQIWAGQIHKTPDGQYKSGRSNTGESKLLTREFVPNYKVQDFRDLKSIENFTIQFEEIENNILPDIDSEGIVNRYALDLDRIDKSVFTDCFLSRDPNGNSRFLFGLNFEKMVKTSSLFKSFFNKTDKQSVRNILSLSRVNEMKLIRRRVRNNIDKIEEFDRNAPPEVIAITGADFGGEIRNVDNSRATLEEIKISHQGQEVIRYFSGIDRGMSFITDGIYQYGVEIDLEDGTANYLKDLLNRLNESKDFLNTYLNMALIPGNYSAESNKFTQRFATVARGIFSENKPWHTPVTNYINVLKILSARPFNETKLIQKLYNIISPYTGGPRGIRFFLKLLENLTTQFENALSTHGIFPSHSNLQVNSQSVHKKSGMPRGRKIVKYFDETFDSNVVKFTGYDFLSESGISSVSEGTTLKIINGGDFIRRTELEKLKYFTSVAEDINFDLPGNQSLSGRNINENALSFLSPSSVNISGHDPLLLLKEEGGLNKNVDRYQEMMLEAVKMNSQIREPVSPRSTPEASVDGTSPITAGSIRNRVRFSDTALGQILSRENVSFVSADVAVSPRPVVDTLVSEEVFGNNKIGTDKFAILKHKAFCFDADYAESLDVYATANKMVEIKFTNDILKKSVPILPNPTVISSYDLRGELNFISRGLSVSAKEPEERLDLQSPEGILTRTEPVTELRYTEQEPSNDCFKSDGFSEPATVGLSPTETTAVTALDLRSAPIQTVSVFVDSVKPSAVTENFHNKGEDFLQNVGNLMFFWTNYKNLMKIEVLTGYKKSWTGATQIRQPIFEKMTYDIYKNSIGKNLLCRMVPYENIYLGVRSPISSCDAGDGCTGFSTGEQDFVKKMSLPVFHKYFIITPENRGLGRLSLGRTEVPINTEPESPSFDMPNLDVELSSRTAQVLNDLEKSFKVKREFVENNPDRILGD